MKNTSFLSTLLPLILFFVSGNGEDKLPNSNESNQKQKNMLKILLEGLKYKNVAAQAKSHAAKAKYEVAENDLMDAVVQLFEAEKEMTKSKSKYGFQEAKSRYEAAQDKLMEVDFKYEAAQAAMIEALKKKMKIAKAESRALKSKHIQSHIK